MSGTFFCGIKFPSLADSSIKSKLSETGGRMGTNYSAVKLPPGGLPRNSVVK